MYPSFGIYAKLGEMMRPLDRVKVVTLEHAIAAPFCTRQLCIHPRQIPHVHAAFTSTAEEIDWAKRVLYAMEESDGAATTVDGKMVNVPVILKARDILDIAGVASTE